jgi:hypothetical protein
MMPRCIPRKGFKPGKRFWLWVGLKVALIASILYQHYSR